MQSFLERWRLPYLVAIAGLTLFFGMQCLRLDVDQDNRSMDADNADQVLVEARFKELFQHGEAILVAIHQAPDVLDDHGRLLVRQMAAEFRGIEGVSQVDSLADTGFDIPPHLEGLLISGDRCTTGINIRLDEFADGGETLSAVIDEIRGNVQRHSQEGVEIFVSGLPMQKFETGRLVRKDQHIFAPLSFLVLGAVLLLITGRWSGLVIPLLVSALTIAWTLGIYSVLGYSLNMITSLLPPVIMTLSVTTTIHIYIDWLQASERDRGARIAAAVKKLYRPCLFASLTTAIGFLSLLTSHTPAVRQFGLFASLGVLISFVLGVTGLAVGLSFLKVPPAIDVEGEGATHGVLSRMLARLSRLAVEHPLKIVLTALAIAVVSVHGLQKVRSNTDLLSFLGTDSQLYHDTRFIDQNLTGVNSIELMISRSDGEKIASLDEVRRIQSFQQAVEQIPAVKHSLSVADLLDAAGPAPLAAQIPFETLVEKIPLDEYLADDLRTTRISLRTEAIGTSEGAKLLDAVNAAALDKLADDYLVRGAGPFYRVIAESNHLVASQVKSFVIAIVLILVAIGIVFRSFLFMGLAIIPNVVPLLMTAAIMGFCKIDLSTGTAMIASVVIGVAVDDTIHFMAAFRKSFRGDCDLALKTTTASTGFALTATTLALSMGFWVAIFGSFQPTFYFALLAGLTMWFALLADLLVLPACLKLAFRGKNQSARGLTNPGDGGHRRREDCSDR